jgi:enoyl-CoA hydratase
VADDYTYFDYRKAGEVATITLNRPDKLNAFDLAMLFEFRRIVDDLRIDLTTRFVILTGTGRAFCAGIDVTEKARQDWYADPHQLNERLFQESGQNLVRDWTNLHQITIAAINGPCVGLGLGLVSVCDFRVMAEDAYFGVYCRRWGVPLIDGGTVRLPRIVGQGRALEIILTGRKVPADECLQIGLCEYVTPSGGAREQAEALAREIARFPQVCVRADRRSAIKSRGLPVRDALVQEWYNGREALIKNGVAGASRFKDGLGRHGDFGRIR